MCPFCIRWNGTKTNTRAWHFPKLLSTFWKAAWYHLLKLVSNMLNNHMYIVRLLRSNKSSPNAWYYRQHIWKSIATFCELVGTTPEACSLLSACSMTRRLWLLEQWSTTTSRIGGPQTSLPMSHPFLKWRGENWTSCPGVMFTLSPLTPAAQWSHISIKCSQADHTCTFSRCIAKKASGEGPRQRTTNMSSQDIFENVSRSAKKRQTLKNCQEAIPTNFVTF